MQRIILFFMLVSFGVHADTINHYINIANNIPQMEMKADQQSQAWARSARTMLTLTSESILETLDIFNETAKQSGAALYCIPLSVKLDATVLNDLIQQTYRNISSLQSDKDIMTVSQVALMGLKNKFPCEQETRTETNKGMISVSATKP
jgi:hypothetical protein